MNREEFLSRLTALLQDVPPAEREEAVQYYQDYFDDAGEGNEAGVIAALCSPEELAKSIKAGLADGGNGGEFTESGFYGYEQRNKNEIMSTDQPGEENQGQWQRGGSGWQQGNVGGNADGGQTDSGKKEPEKPMSAGKMALLVLLVILLSPVWIGVLGGLFGGAVGLFGGLLGVLIAVLTVGVVLTVVGIALVIAGITAVVGMPLGGLCLAGAGLMMTGVGLVFAWLTVLVVGKAIPALVRGIVNLCGRIFHRGGERA